MSVIQSIKKLHKKKQLRDDLLSILETPEGKRFFTVLLKECHVTKPVFHTEEAKLRECEGRRRLAMSFLSVLGQDDPQSLINQIESQNKDV